MFLKPVTNKLKWLRCLSSMALAGMALYLAVSSIAASAEESGKMLTATKDPTTHEVVLGNDTVRVRFPWETARFEQFPNGYTGYILEMCKDGQWVQMAVSPYFSAFTYRSGWGRHFHHYVIPRSAEVSQDNEKARVVFKETLTDLDRGSWFFEASFEVRPGSPFVETTYTMKVDTERDVFLFDGPRLHVGEGSFGDAMDEALFPGIEYLQKGERSSHMAALAPEVRINLVPPPAKITIPLMAIYNEGCVAGLMWDPMKPWLGSHTCPSALFASPNWLEDQPNHLMGLFLPSVPDYVAENSMSAHTPVTLKAGETMRLESALFAAPASSSADAVDLWLQRRGGLPAPSKTPYSYLEQINEHARILVDDSWNKKGDGWFWDYDGKPSYNAGVASALAKALPFIEDKKLAERTIERIQVVAKDAAYLPLSFRWGNLARAMEANHSFAHTLIDSQKEDGSWVHNQTKDAELGLFWLMAPPNPPYIVKDGERSQGISARRASEVLEYALLANDPAALAAGLRGIEDMNRYTVPYVYDNDECPQAPSLHGSYCGMRACLLAYRITENPTYLEQAKRWAKTGLPFVYMWSFGPREVETGHIHAEKKFFLKGKDLYKNTKRDPMLYGALYGYGSSQYMFPWYGVLVQWIGFEYAEDLARLAKYDTSFPWKTVSDGLISSAMWQAFDKKPYAGYFPDAFSTERWMPSGPAFSPAALMETMFLTNFDVADWDTTIVRNENARFHITSSKCAGDAAISGGMLRFTLDDPACTHVRAVVTDLPPTAQITVDGQALPQVEDLESVEEGWQRNPYGLALLKVCQKEKPRAIEAALTAAP